MREKSLKELSEGFVSDQAASKSKSPNNNTKVISDLHKTPQSAVFQETSRSNIEPPNREEGYYLSMGDMIAQHHQLQINEGFNDQNQTNIIVPNSRLSNLSGDREKKSVSSKRGGSLRKGLPMSQKSTVKNDKIRKKSQNRSGSQRDEYRPLRTVGSVKNMAELGSQLKRASRSIGMGSKPAIPRNTNSVGNRVLSEVPQRVKLHSKLEATFKGGSEGKDTLETRKRRKAYSSNMSN